MVAVLLLLGGLSFGRERMVWWVGGWFVYFNTFLDRGNFTGRALCACLRSDMREDGSQNYEHPGLVVSSKERVQRNGVSALVIDDFQGSRQESNNFMINNTSK